MSGPRDPEADARRMYPEYDPDWPSRDLEAARNREASPDDGPANLGGWPAESRARDPWGESWDREPWGAEEPGATSAPDAIDPWGTPPEPTVGDPWSESWESEADATSVWERAAFAPPDATVAEPEAPVAEPPASEPVDVERPAAAPDAPPTDESADDAGSQPWWLEPVPVTEPDFEPFTPEPEIPAFLEPERPPPPPYQAPVPRAEPEPEPEVPPFLAPEPEPEAQPAPTATDALPEATEEERVTEPIPIQPPPEPPAPIETSPTPEPRRSLNPLAALFGGSRSAEPKAEEAVAEPPPPAPPPVEAAPEPAIEAAPLVEERIDEVDVSETAPAAEPAEPEAWAWPVAAEPEALAPPPADVVDVPVEVGVDEGTAELVGEITADEAEDQAEVGVEAEAEAAAATAEVAPIPATFGQQPAAAIVEAVEAADQAAAEAPEDVVEETDAASPVEQAVEEPEELVAAAEATEEDAAVVEEGTVAAEEPPSGLPESPPGLPEWLEDLDAWRPEPGEEMELWPTADAIAPPPPAERAPQPVWPRVDESAAADEGPPEVEEEELLEQPRGPLAPTAGPIATARTSAQAEPQAAEEPAGERSTLAEAAVPWLIGIVLFLTGMVIILLALIFAGEESLGLASDPSTSPNLLAGAAGSGAASPSTAATPTAAPSSAAATPTAPPIPDYGPLEMVYLGRAAALEPIYLLTHDFTTEEEPAVLAQDPELDVRHFTWAPDGRIGAALLVDVLVSIEPDVAKRRLADGISALTFGDDASTVYAVRVTADGANDVAAVLAVDYVSGDATEVASVTYPRPAISSEDGLHEAQFADDGGPVRLFWMEDDILRLWVLGAGTWEIDADGEVTTLEDDARPVLWSPDGRHRVVVAESGTSSTLVLYRSSGAEAARTTISGLVSHLRWSADSEQVVFSVGRAGPSGGVRQDLFLWQLEDGAAPMQLTNTGAAFAPEWRGSTASWRE